MTRLCVGCLRRGYDGLRTFLVNHFFLAHTQLLRWTPSTWAMDYHGAWLDSLSLLVTATSVPGTAPVGSAVGSLSVSVLPSGMLTSLDGTSAASNGSTVVAAGSWGDVVCDSGAVVFSHTALAVAFAPPPNASYVPSGYVIHVSSSRAFAANASTIVVPVTPAGSLGSAVGLPPPWLPTALRYVVAGLAVDTAYYVRVGVTPPALPADVSTILPRTVPVVFSALSEPGTGCSCGSARAGLPCAAAPSQAAVEYTPRRPVIGVDKFAEATPCVTRRVRPAPTVQHGLLCVTCFACAFARPQKP
jgi:hypothetical protein